MTPNLYHLPNYAEAMKKIRAEEAERRADTLELFAEVEHARRRLARTVSLWIGVTFIVAGVLVATWFVR